MRPKFQSIINEDCLRTTPDNFRIEKIEHVLHFQTNPKKNRKDGAKRSKIVDAMTVPEGRSYVKSRFSEAERQAIAARIRDHMARNSINRKALEKPNLKIGLINKALTGGFSDDTLAKIETILGRSFSDVKAIKRVDAPKTHGGYSHEDITELEGDYLCIRPVFAKPHILSAYKITLSWCDNDHCLKFHESERFDSKYTQSGDVYNPPKNPYFNLVTMESGSIRLITLSMPDECGVCRGLLTTLNNPHGMLYTPTSTPVVMIKSHHGCFQKFGLIGPDSDFYSRALDLIDSVVSEEYARFVTVAKPIDKAHSSPVHREIA